MSLVHGYSLHIPIIWHVFTGPVIMSLVHGVSTVTKHDKWSYKSGHINVFYMATPSQATESAGPLSLELKSVWKQPEGA